MAPYLATRWYVGAGGAVSVSASVCVCVSACVCVCVSALQSRGCVYMYMQMYPRRPDVKYLPQPYSILLFETGSLTDLKLAQKKKQDVSPKNPSSLPVSTSLVLALQVNASMPDICHISTEN